VGKNVVNFTLLELLSRFYAEVASDYWSLLSIRENEPNFSSKFALSSVIPGNHELPKRTRNKMTDNQVQVG
jgi:hypothetical protein